MANKSFRMRHMSFLNYQGGYHAEHAVITMPNMP
jgi:hypothetical protein